MNSDWSSRLARWTEAGLVDSATAERIRAFEREHADAGRLRWPILLALAFGALMLGGGILLFISANWDALSPTQRFSLVLLLVGGFHVAGALAADRFPAMSTAMHAIGTVALGGGIALAGQIFHLDEHWPGGIMLWAVGAALAWGVLRQTPQMALVAVLAPAWLGSEWTVAMQHRLDADTDRVLAAGVLLLAATYFTATGAERASHTRRTLVWIGGLALPVAALAAVLARHGWIIDTRSRASTLLLSVGWTAAIALPLIVSWVLRRRAAWPVAVAAVWVVVLVHLDRGAYATPTYAWCALGAIGLVAWGLRDARSERINMGAAFFAVTVLTFYFSEVMDKLGRSASLAGLGVLFLAGGWGLEHLRRQLVLKARGSA
jgi:hypothetical protein